MVFGRNFHNLLSPKTYISKQLWYYILGLQAATMRRKKNTEEAYPSHTAQAKRNNNKNEWKQRKKEWKKNSGAYKIKAKHYNVLKDKHVLAIWFFQNVYVTESVRAREFEATAATATAQPNAVGCWMKWNSMSARQINYIRGKEEWNQCYLLVVFFLSHFTYTTPSFDCHVFEWSIIHTSKWNTHKKSEQNNWSHILQWKTKMKMSLFAKYWRDWEWEHNIQ